ncbi:hypothetical protein OE88DRAFT_1650749 [Heliocybe sulcata]|uniref:MYND-type domain-containing protein n=1 Tax=Heliocybe sulcata TaxID=5364 RepID=A0A5C3NL07_9AGAM|nr:hypothetical protein OE88DRAFT_1650749 [Heliocybe sulcata]
MTTNPPMSPLAALPLPMSEDFAVALGLKESIFPEARQAQATMTESERVELVYWKLLVRLRMEPLPQQEIIFSRLTAFYLLKLLEKWRTLDDPNSIYFLMLPHLSDNIYFQTFFASGHRAARNLTLDFAKQLVKAQWSTRESYDMIFDACQHLSTMLIYEDSETVLPPSLTRTLIDKISAWERVFPSGPDLAPLPRAIGLLKRQVSWVRQGREVRKSMERKLRGCNLRGCEVPYDPAADNLSQCSACKSARYCSTQHQRQDWKTHKQLCHRPAWLTDV